MNDDQPSICDRASGCDEPGPIVSQPVLACLQANARLTVGDCPIHGEDALALILHSGETICYHCGRTTT